MNKKINKFIILLIVVFLSAGNKGICESDNDITAEISENSKITRIEFEGNHLVPAVDIRKVMDLQIGDTYSKDLVQQNLKAIYKTEDSK